MNKKKVGLTIFYIACIIFIIVCINIQIKVNKQTEELKEEAKKYESLVTTTKSGEQIETEYTRIENNKFFLKVPTNFRQLTSEEINQKYIGNVPETVFSNEDGSINVAINTTENEMKNEEISSYKIQMENDAKENNWKVINSNYYEVDNHNISQIKMISSVNNSNIYNNTIAFSYKDKLVLITFKCKEELKEEWEGIGDFIIDSLFLAD